MITEECLEFEKAETSSPKKSVQTFLREPGLSQRVGAATRQHTEEGR